MAPYVSGLSPCASVTAQRPACFNSVSVGFTSNSVSCGNPLLSAPNTVSSLFVTPTSSSFLHHCTGSNRDLRLRCWVSRGSRAIRLVVASAADKDVTSSSVSPAVKEGEKGEKVPAWAKPGSEEAPPWAKGEAARAEGLQTELPFYVYLIFSALITIATVGSVFEYFNQNPVFGVVQPDSPLWAPILGLFALTGLPSAGFCLYKAITLANEASQKMDSDDGFSD
eukprot:TRINITY_DN2913_c0_g1_i1.p1 TRINITY_DN2913_c0_g1~~TRINITY_DN2913_c0_g1_i1.p1  ORF type:complete len:224 (-),score=33.12 TRINITY_DN2913_c0_g1_i1:535-1206(-)